MLLTLSKERRKSKAGVLDSNPRGMARSISSVRARLAATLLAATLPWPGTGLWAQRAALPFSPADATVLEAKLDGILRRAGAAPNGGPAPAAVRTVVHETEINAFLTYRAADQLPGGLARPEVLALGDGRVCGRAVVDLETVRAARPRSVFDPLRYVGGRVPVVVVGVLRTLRRDAWFDLETASVGGVPVPRRVAQELVWYFTRGSMYPDGIVLGQPFRMPLRIREIDVRTGQAVILQ